MKIPIILFDKRFILGTALLGLLAAWFWGKSRIPALNDKALMGGSVDLSGIGFDTVVKILPDSSLIEQIAYNSLNWMYTNRMGMLFGLLFAALLMTLLPLLNRRSFRSGLANTLAGIAVGTPLGVCVNCAAPIAQGLRTAGARAETALAAMFSSPTLNIIVLTMLFSLLPFHLAIIKIGLTLGFILIFVPLLTRLVPPSPSPALEADGSNASILGTAPPFMADSCDIAPPGDWLGALLWLIRSFARNLWYIVRRTVPLMVLAGVLGAALITVLPFESLAEIVPEKGLLLTLAAMILMSLIGTFLPVPIAFDVIVVAILIQAGLPLQYALILLFTLGIYSIYSFSIVWQSISRLHAVAIFIMVATLGVLAGYLGHYAGEWHSAREKALLAQWTKDQMTSSPRLQVQPAASAVYPLSERKLVLGLEQHALTPHVVLKQANLSLAKLPFTTRSKPLGQAAAGAKTTWFSRHDGRDFGVDAMSRFTILDITSPHQYFRAIATGDIHGDGWPDLLLTTNNGLALYANQQGKGFMRQEIPGSLLEQVYIVNAALVDLNNDGWLDIYLSTHRQGNRVLYNRSGRFDEDTLQTLPNLANALTTAATTFGDLDRDGDLDIALGNWSIGEMTTNALSYDNSRNALLLNQSDGFSLRPLTGVGGETLSMLFTDFDLDDDLDLLVGNDFNPADTYYLGDGAGGLRKLTPSDEIIPHSTRWTMSFTTADIDNNLAPDIYAVQISAGEAIHRPNEQLCSEYPDATLRQQCLNMRQITNAVQDSNRKQDVSICLSLKPEDQDGCVAIYQLMTAIFREKDSSYCDGFSEAWDELAFLCKYHFESPSTKVGLKPDGEIPSVTDPNMLLMPNGEGGFVDRAEEFGLTIGGWGWNAKFADLDLDEWQDVYLVSGFIGPVLMDSDFDANYLYRNRKGHAFDDWTEVSGLGSFLETVSYSYIDIDHDGDLDIVSVPMFGPVLVFMNQTSGGHPISFELRDHVGNKFGVGSKIIVRYGDGRQQMREIQAGGGFLSFDAPIAHFGLGTFDRVHSVEIVWSTGERSLIEHNLASGARYLITREGAHGEPPDLVTDVSPIKSQAPQPH